MTRDRSFDCVPHLSLQGTVQPVIHARLRSRPDFSTADDLQGYPQLTIVSLIYRSPPPDCHSVPHCLRVSSLSTPNQPTSSTRQSADSTRTRSWRNATAAVSAPLPHQEHYLRASRRHLKKFVPRRAPRAFQPHSKTFDKTPVASPFYICLLPSLRTPTLYCYFTLKTPSITSPSQDLHVFQKWHSRVRPPSLASESRRRSSRSLFSARPRTVCQRFR